MRWTWRGHLRSATSSRPRQRGQVMVLFAISLLVLIVAVGIAVDGGFGLFEYRQAQNAADFAAEGAATDLLGNCSSGSNLALNGDIGNIITDLVTKNSPSTNPTSGWSAYYLNSAGKALVIAGYPDPLYVDSSYAPAGTDAPLGACGVYVKVSPQWPAFMAQVIGFTTLKTAAGAAAVNSYTRGAGNLTAIAALGEDGAHVIFEGGNGVFDVDGTIYDNSNGWLNSSHSVWGGSGGSVDVMDGKQDGSMDVEGNVQSYAANPFDWCFGWPLPNRNVNTTTQSTISCSANGGHTKIEYYGWFPNDGAGGVCGGSSGSQEKCSPLDQTPGSPPKTDAFCGTNAVQVNPTPGTAGNGDTVYYPGVYTKPLIINSDNNVILYNCSQTLDPSDASSLTSDAEAGMFYFEQGVALDPPSGYTVTGNDVLLVTSSPIPDQTSGSFKENTGDGEEPIGDGSGQCTLTDTYESCNNVNGPGPDCGSEPAPTTSAAAGTNCNAVTDKENSTSDQGLNYSLEIGGQGTVTLTASTGTGFPWTDFVTWQLTPGSSNPTALPANVGLDGEPSDSADINLTGILYDNSDQVGQDLSHPQYWDGNAGIPFLPGGMLLTGYGVAGGTDGTGFSCGTSGDTSTPPARTPGCNVQINGLAAVDEFQTEGYSTFNITGSTYELPGIQGTGAILTQ